MDFTLPLAAWLVWFAMIPVLFYARNRWEFIRQATEILFLTVFLPLAIIVMTFFGDRLTAFMAGMMLCFEGSRILKWIDLWALKRRLKDAKEVE